MQTEENGPSIVRRLGVDGEPLAERRHGASAHVRGAVLHRANGVRGIMVTGSLLSATMHPNSNLDPFTNLDDGLGGGHA